MCRYAFKEYKSRFACFDCRKAFKKIAIVDYMKAKGMDQAYERLSRDPVNTPEQKKLECRFGTTYQEIHAAYNREVGSCPQCGKSMAAMGLDFKAPPVDDQEAWKIIEMLYQHGFAFAGCGCGVGYTPPKKLRDVDRFLEQHEKRSKGEILLAAIAGKSF